MNDKVLRSNVSWKYLLFQRILFVFQTHITKLIFVRTLAQMFYKWYMRFQGGGWQPFMGHPIIIIRSRKIEKHFHSTIFHFFFNEFSRRPLAIFDLSWFEPYLKDIGPIGSSFIWGFIGLYLSSYLKVILDKYGAHEGGGSWQVTGGQKLGLAKPSYLHIQQQKLHGDSNLVGGYLHRSWIFFGSDWSFGKFSLSSFV